MKLKKCITKNEKFEEYELGKFKMLKNLEIEGENNCKLAIGRYWITDWITEDQAENEAEKPNIDTLMNIMVAISNITYEINQNPVNNGNN